MNTQSKLAKHGKRIAIAATFGALCFFVGVPRAQAEDGRSCQWRVERAESRLRDAVEDHGYYSRQAYDRRRDLSYEQQRCSNQFHIWFNYGNQWRNDRDRDDRYRDRDRDRDRDHDRDRNHDRDDHRDRDRDWR